MGLTKLKTKLRTEIYRRVRFEKNANTNHDE